MLDPKDLEELKSDLSSFIEGKELEWQLDRLNEARKVHNNNMRYEDANYNYESYKATDEKGTGMIRTEKEKYDKLKNLHTKCFKALKRHDKVVKVGNTEFRYFYQNTDQGRDECIQYNRWGDPSSWECIEVPNV